MKCGIETNLIMIINIFCTKILISSSKIISSNHKQNQQNGNKNQIFIDYHNPHKCM